MHRFRSEILSGWGRFPMEPCHLYRPERRAEVASVLAEADEPSFVARGLGRSYGDAAVNRDAGVISSLRLNRMLGFAEGLLECEAGVSLDDIIRVFLPRGWFLPVTPGTRLVTVGGAIAANVHGKNHPRAGAFGSHLESLTLLIPSGEVLTCSAAENADVFRATIGGMGLTGVILTARVRLRPVESAWMRTTTRRAPTLDQAMAELSGGAEYAMGWVDCAAGGGELGRGLVAAADHAAAAEVPLGRTAPAHPAAPRRIPLPPVAGRVGRLAVRAFNTAVYRAPRATGERLQSLLDFFYPLDGLRDWNRLYGRSGMVQYQCAFPTESSPAGVSAVLRGLARGGAVPRLSVLKRLGPAREGLLSFPIEGYTLAVDLPARRDVRGVLREIDRIVLDAGGRVYLAKDAVMDRDTFSAMYPGADEFRAIAARLDPEGRISSSLARRVGLVDR